MWLLGNTLGPPRCNKSHLLTMCSTMELWKELMLVALPGSLRPCMLLTVALWLCEYSQCVCVSLLLSYVCMRVCILNACINMCIKCLGVETLCNYCVCRCVYLCITPTFPDEPSRRRLVKVPSMILSPLCRSSCLCFHQLRAFSAFHQMRSVSGTFAHLTWKVYTA